MARTVVTSSKKKSVKKSPKVRRYSVAWRTLYCGLDRKLTLHASNKKEAYKLVADRYPAQGKYVVTVIR